nr:CDGSH iron-sulfur domain-containing protein [Psychrobacter sp. PraFG1]UNK05269.1 CDGSH iron-sulfur domain-containing protein [Psychrobacter sp. PraFG1]
MDNNKEVVKSDNATVTFDSNRCIHSRNCVLGRPDVFVPNVDGEWIHPENASPDELLEIAHNCPSGAIQVYHPDGTPMETAPKVNTIRVTENGPSYIHAKHSVQGEDNGTRMVLCRCGHSKQKPYCDGSHKEVNFEATGEPASVEIKLPEVKDASGSELRIEPMKNGPNFIYGNVEVVTGTGRTITRDTEVHLCRCGHSAHKPFCDSTHVKVGFEADGFVPEKNRI